MGLTFRVKRSARVIVVGERSKAMSVILDADLWTETGQGSSTFIIGVEDRKKTETAG